MTKLKQPIVVKIETVECATMLRQILDMPMHKFSERVQKLALACQVKTEDGIQAQIVTQLTAQGIDYRTWEPPQPLLIASHEVTANPDGSIKVGCTAVTRPALEAAYKLSTEAMQQEPEWPRYYEFKGDSQRYHMAKSEASVVQIDRGGIESVDSYFTFASLEREVSKGDRKRLTPLEAKAILEGKS